MRSLAHNLGGPQRVSDMISGKGISMILKQIEVNYRRPVTYPDTVSVSTQFPMQIMHAMN